MDVELWSGPHFLCRVWSSVLCRWQGMSEWLLSWLHKYCGTCLYFTWREKRHGPGLSSVWLCKDYHFNITCSAPSIFPQDRQQAALSRLFLNALCSAVVRIVSLYFGYWWMGQRVEWSADRWLDWQRGKGICIYPGVRFHSFSLLGFCHVEKEF